MSSSTRQNPNRAVSKVQNLLDQLIADLPENQKRPTPPKSTTRNSQPKSAELDRLFSYIDGKAHK